MAAGKVQHLFLRTVVLLLLVYLVEGQNTCVVLHIRTTHLSRSENGWCEVIGTGGMGSSAWGKQARGVVAISAD
jgi:hypothetical protein